MKVKPLVLLVEDEQATADFVKYELREHGFDVRHESDGDSAWTAFRRQQPDLVLLDLGLPGVGGLDLFRLIRGLHPGQAVIMVTDRVGEADRVLGLELGADDYVTKPFSARELAARVKAVLRRRNDPAGPGRLRRHGPLELDEEAYTLKVLGRPVALTRGEFALLGALMRHPARAFDRDHLLETMHGMDGGALTDRSVDTAIRRLRQKIAEVRPGLDPIETLYGIGYKLHSGLEEAP